MKMQKELEWKEPIEIQDGKHSGTIIRVEFRSDPYEYTDIVIKLDDADIEMKYGCPTVLSENSKLGRLVIAMGEKFEKGKKVNPEKTLKDKKVEFMTLTKKSKQDSKKSYSEIVADSIKPIEG
jgi:hypothetical protein